MEQGIKRTQRDYSLAFKLSVVERVEKGGLTYKEAQRRYGIKGRSTVLVWLRKHGLQDWSARSNHAQASESMSNQQPKPQTAEQRIKELETQLRESQERAALFEAVIEIMRKEHGVELKKPLGRASRKSTSKG
jgi:transposase-like protein